VANPDAQPARNPLKGRTLAGIPWWIWAAGAAAAVGADLYYRHVNSAAASNAGTAAAGSGSSSGAGPTGLTSSQLQQFLVNQQSSPSAKSGWIKVAGKNVWYSARNNTLGFKQGGKWTKEAA
jgi:hypothetical protein